MSKTIKIQVWTDLYYARFIAIWRPEEAEDYEAPTDDTRSEVEKNIPYLLVTTSMYEGRDEVVGASPVAPSQHPMPDEFLQQQTRHISYMFANEYGIWKAPTKALADTFISKMTVNYTMVKEYDVTVSPAQGSMSLKALRDSLAGYTDEELESIQVMTIGEHPDDAHSKGIEEYIHTAPNTTTEQYYSVTKLTPVYEIEDPYLNNSQLDDSTASNSVVPGTEEADMAAAETAKTEDAVATDSADQATLETFDDMTAPDAMAASTAVTETPAAEPTLEETQAQTIKDLQAEIEALKAAGTATPGDV